jgi:hypothetical protein
MHPVLSKDREKVSSLIAEISSRKLPLTPAMQLEIIRCHCLRGDLKLALDAFERLASAAKSFTSSSSSTSSSDSAAESRCMLRARQSIWSAIAGTRDTKLAVSYFKYLGHIGESKEADYAGVLGTCLACLKRRSRDASSLSSSSSSSSLDSSAADPPHAAAADLHPLNLWPTVYKSLLADHDRGTVQLSPELAACVLELQVHSHLADPFSFTMDSAVSLLRDLCARGVSPDRSCFHVLLRGYASRPRRGPPAAPGWSVDGALAIKAEMLRYGVAPDAETYRFLFDACVSPADAAPVDLPRSVRPAPAVPGAPLAAECLHQYGRVDARYAAIDADMRARSVPHTPASLLSLIRVLGLAGRYTAAFALFKRARIMGFERTPVFWQVLFASCFRSPIHACIILDLRPLLVSEKPRPVSVTPELCELFVAACGTSGRLHLAEAFIADLRNAGHEPTGGVHNAFVVACLLNGNGNVATEALGYMQRTGIPRERRTVHAMMWFLARKGDWAGAEKLVASIIAASTQDPEPAEPTGRGGRVEEAEEVDDVMYFHLCDAYLQAGELGKCEDLLTSLTLRHESAVSIRTALVRAGAHLPDGMGGMVAAADDKVPEEDRVRMFETLRRMRLPVRPRPSSFLALATALAERGDFAGCERVLTLLRRCSVSYRLDDGFASDVDAREDARYGTLVAIATPRVLQLTQMCMGAIATARMRDAREDEVAYRLGSIFRAPGTSSSSSAAAAAGAAAAATGVHDSSTDRLLASFVDREKQINNVSPPSLLHDASADRLLASFVDREKQINNVSPLRRLAASGGSLSGLWSSHTAASHQDLVEARTSQASYLAIETAKLGTNLGILDGSIMPPRRRSNKPGAAEVERRASMMAGRDAVPMARRSVTPELSFARFQSTRGDRGGVSAWMPAAPLRFHGPTVSYRNYNPSWRSSPASDAEAEPAETLPTASLDLDVAMTSARTRRLRGRGQASLSWAERRAFAHREA